MDDHSFVRFGGLAAILLALTSWAAVIAYAALVEPGDARLGLQIVHFLYALIAGRHRGGRGHLGRRDV